MEGNKRKERILHIIPSLGRGGAEAMLVSLVANLTRFSVFEHVILSMLTTNEFQKELTEAGVKVYGLGLKSAKDAFLPGSFFKLRKLVKQIQPSIIQGWMYHGNLAAYFCGHKPFLFSVHSSLDALENEKWLTNHIIKRSAFLSRKAHRVIYCSDYSRRQHISIGYSKNNSLFIPNGFNTSFFKPDPLAEKRIKEHFKISKDAVLFGQLARYHPIKNHKGLLESFSKVIRHYKEVRLLLVGSGCDEDNGELKNIIKQHGLKDHVLLLGMRKDVNSILPGLDALISPSFAEAFPIVLGEAMSCGILCIATDVGDSAKIVSNTGFIIPPANPEALTDSIMKVANMSKKDRYTLGNNARQHILDNYRLEVIAKKYEAVYCQLLTKPIG